MIIAFRSNLLSLFFVAFHFLSLSEGRCLVYYQPKPIVNFDKYPGDLFMAFRSNPKFFWDFSKKNEANPEYSDLFKLFSIGIGDFHVLNIADIELKNGSREIGLVDIDDIGIQIPFALDLARGISQKKFFPKVVVNSESFASVDTTSKAFTAYLKGLLGETFSSDFIDSILTKTADDFQVLYEKFIKKNVKDNKLIIEKDVFPLSQAPESIQKVYNTSKFHFETALQKYNQNLEILDIVYRIKVNGGSKGVPRFLYLVRSPNNKLEIIEFKKFEDSSAIFLSQQGSAEERFEASKKFRPKTTDQLGLFSLVKTDPNTYFIARSKLPSFIHFDISKSISSKEIDNLNEYYLYLFSLKGKFDRLNLSTEDAVWIETNSEGILKSLKAFVRDFSNALEKANK